MNIAVEEAMTHAFSAGVQLHPTVRFWVNPKAAVVGRFQEVAAEVNVAHCELSNVSVVRRFTGGGTVFHDESTLNFTILNGRGRREISPLGFQEVNMRLVREALSSFGVHCVISPPNSILIDERKVCGAAAAVGKCFTLWHCSILVDTNTKLLAQVLAPSKSRSPSRFVRSNWQPVTTLSSALTQPIGVRKVEDCIRTSVEKSLGVRLRKDQLSKEEVESAQSLYDTKYSSNVWNMNGNLGSDIERKAGDHTTIAV